MRAGKLKQRVTIEKLVTGSPAQKPSGEPDTAWVALLEDIAAEWMLLSGRELFAAQAHHQEVKGIWRVRWRDSIAGQVRVVFGGLYYNVLYLPPVDRMGRKWELDLECSEGVAEG